MASSDNPRVPPATPGKDLIIAFCWPAFSGYMAACWRALAMRPGIRVRGLAFRSSSTSGAGFDPALLEGTGIELVDVEEGFNAESVRRRIAAIEPDVVVLSGWFNPAFRLLASAPELDGSRFVMCMDNPWLGSIRQRLGVYRHRRFLQRMDAVVVAGERAFQFARRLGFRESQIETGLYGFAADLADRVDASHPDPIEDRRTFLYLGRYAPEKGLVQLLKSYELYRQQQKDPWRLLCCGGGALQSFVQKADGVEDAGFVQPVDLPARFAEASALVLPSSFEPWGVAIAEGAMAGLPVVCSRACGASVEVVRHLHNGYVFGTNSGRQLRAGLDWMHSHPERLATMGQNSRNLAAPFGAGAWADRWEHHLRALAVKD